MTDSELLEMAAKAADLELQQWVESRNTFFLEPYQCHWNPLENDGDALRLAVKLRLRIDHNHSADQQRWVAADRNGCEGCYAPVSCVEDEFEEADRHAATRRAIVRAAAQIGAEKIHHVVFQTKRENKMSAETAWYQCQACGDQMAGDGYTTVRHCPNANENGTAYAEPDSGLIYCKSEET